MARSHLRKLMDKHTIGSERELFVDNYNIDSMKNVKRRIHQPAKYKGNPIMLPDRPWEMAQPEWPIGDMVWLHGTVMYDTDEKLFKMWYLTRSGQCYAVSRDGIHWEKPDVNLIEYNGSKHNNIIHMCIDRPGQRAGKARADGLHLIKDMNEKNPARRYKGLSFQATLGQWPLGPYPKAGLYVSFSRDGIRWRTRKEPILTHYEDDLSDRTDMTYDHKRKKYIAFTKGAISHDVQGACGWLRTRTISESDDFIHWTKPVEILRTDDKDARNLEIYSMGGWIYQSMYLAHIGMLHNYRRMDIQLACSRDGKYWWRAANRATFIPNGEKGEWDSGIIACPGNAPIEVGDELWFYYSGVDKLHRFADQTMINATSGVGLAKLRKDGFVSVDAGENEGSLLTKPFMFRGKKLLVNASARGGHLRAEILDEDDEAIPAFSRERSIPVRVNTLSKELKWRGDPNLRKLAKKAIAIRFYLRNAELYSFWFKP